MYLCWSAKGGSGTTVIAAALGLVLSHHRPTLLVDLGGDAPAALGMAEPPGPGVHEWLASPTADADALHRLAVPASDALMVVPCGAGDQASGQAGGQAGVGSRWAQLAGALASLSTARDTEVVVDAGSGVPPPELLATAQHRLLVIRPCYLALRRAIAQGAPATGVVLVQEPGRALSARDVSRTLGVPVVAEVHYDPAVARAVDAGLLVSRLPRSLTHQLAQPLRAVA